MRLALGFQPIVHTLRIKLAGREARAASTSTVAGKLVYVSTLLDTNIWEVRLSGQGDTPTMANLLSSTRLDSGGQ